MHAQAAEASPMVGSTTLATPPQNGGEKAKDGEQTAPGQEKEVPETKEAAQQDSKDAGQRSGSDSRQDVPQDRTLELAGLEALLKQHDRSLAAPPTGANPPKSEINWTTHKKDGMRLKRLMEESSEGQNFPHMKDMWKGSAADTR